MRRQLDLFSDHKPGAELILFPLVRRCGLIRQAASEMASMTDAQILKYWPKFAKRIAQPLIATGVPREVIRDQLRDLYDEIVMEAFWNGDADASPTERA